MTTTTDTPAEVEAPHVWTLTPAEWDATRAKVAKINDRAERRGFTGRITITGEKETVTRNLNGFTVTEQVVRVTLTGEAPSYDGWKLVAALDFDPHAGLVTRPAPGVDVTIDRDAVREGWCDHCQTTRARRRTFLVEHTDGNRQQVGTTCLKDFLGWAGRITWIDEDDVTGQLDRMFTGHHAEPAYGVETVLAVAYAAIKAHRFIPSARPGSTRDTVLAVLDPRNRHDEAAADALWPLADEATEKVAAIREWIADADRFPADSEYAANLKAVAGADFATGRNLGLLVSAPHAYTRAVEREVARKAEAEALVDCPEGRVDVEGEVLAIRSYDNDYGPGLVYKVLVRVTTDAGLFKVWGTPPRAIVDAEVGDRVRFTATVTPKEGEHGFGYFKRPSKAEVVTTD